MRVSRGLILAVVLGLLFAAPSVSGQPPVSYVGHKVVRAHTDDASELDALLGITPDVWSERIGVGPLDVRIPPAALADLDASGIDYEILIDDVQALIDASQAGPQGPGFFDDYKTHPEVNARLDLLEELRPDLATVFDVGLSIEGREIRGIRITGPGADKPAVFLQGCQHAREWIAVMVPVYIADRLIMEYDNDPSIQDLLAEVELIIVPIVNPDGYVYSHDVNRLWRKNRRDNGDGTFGVDLNRNWSFQWGGPGSSGNTGSQTYRGTAPFSEPESSATRDLVLANPQIEAFVDIHSYTQLILQPWGYSTMLHPDHDIYEDLCGTMTEQILDVHGSVYEHGPGGVILYVASGVAPDWAVGDFGVTGMTIELRDTGQFGFLLPPDQIIPNCEELFPAITYLSEWINFTLQFTYPLPLPETMEPDAGVTFVTEILEVNDTVLDVGSVTAYARIGDSGPFSEMPATDLGNNQFLAELPAAPCGSIVQYYLQAQTTEGDVVTDPATAPAELFETTAIYTTFTFTDDGETDLGWTVSGDATDGQWDRGIPIGGGDRGDPPTDADGSGQCHLTDNVDGNSDVDGGSTTLTSPIMDATAPNAVISYHRWFSNDFGASPFQDIFVVEISNDGGQSWQLLESVGPDGPEVQGGWIHKSFLVSDQITPTDQFRIRFTASDEEPGSVVEAGIDGIKLSSAECPGDAPFRRGDSTADGAFDISDPILTLQHLFVSPTATCEVALDSNDDESLGLGDPLHSLMALFANGPLPAEPFVSCGTDPTPGPLGCASFASCGSP